MTQDGPPTSARRRRDWEVHLRHVSLRRVQRDRKRHGVRAGRVGWDGYAAKSSDVETVIIDGRIVMRDRELQTLDEGGVIAEAEREYKALIERAGI